MARPGRGSASTRTVSATRRRPAGSSSAGMVPASRPSGRCRHRTSTRARPASSSPAGTCTYSARRRPRPSRGGPGSGRRMASLGVRGARRIAGAGRERRSVTRGSWPPTRRRSAPQPGPAAARAAPPERRHFFLLRGADRELLVPDATRRGALWTTRVWPGAVLVGGEVVGTWRRADAVVTIQPWRRLAPRRARCRPGRGGGPAAARRQERRSASAGTSDPVRRQLTDFFTSAAIVFSSAAVSFVSAHDVAHMVPSSRWPSSSKPNVAYRDLNLSALLKKQTTLPSSLA